MKTPVRKIAVVCLISYDANLIFKSLPSYYDYADKIILGTEKRRLSNIMQPIQIPEEFFKKIKKYPKAELIEENFYSHERTPMDNERAIRNGLSALVPDNYWLVSIDSDEALANPGCFFHWLKHHADPNKLIMAQWVHLFKQLSSNQFLVVTQKNRQNIFVEGFPVATTQKESFTWGRFTKQEMTGSPLVAVHYHCARKEDELRLKLKSWGHTHEVRSDFMPIWLSANEHNYKSFSDLHPCVHNVWPALALKSLSQISLACRFYVLLYWVKTFLRDRFPFLVRFWGRIRKIP